MKKRRFSFFTKAAMNIELYAGKDIKPFLDEVALLRLKIFRDFPYLYDGTLEKEEHYLKMFVQVDSSVLVVAREGKKIVGFALGLPFSHAFDLFKTSFVSNKMGIENVFYLSDFIVAKEYRCKGIGTSLYEKFEKYVKEHSKYTKINFCDIIRPKDDPRKPKDYSPSGFFWSKHGFTKHPELNFTSTWKEIGERQETLQYLLYWMKDIGKSV